MSQTPDANAPPAAPPSARTVEQAVERTVVICAKRETVFRYFTDSARFAAWWGPGSTIDARVGGAVSIHYPGGQVASGSVLEIVPPERVVFSYGYEGEGKPIAPGGSVVTVTLEERRSGTLVSLRHEVGTRELREMHEPGWRFQLSLFSNVVAAEQHAGVADVLDRWFAAWNAKTAEERDELLDASVADDVTFHDSFAAISSRGELAHHLSLVPVHMPGFTMKRDGEPKQCQGTAVVEWRAEGPDGALKARGTNVAELAPDGRLQRVVGFWSGRPG